MNIGCDCSMEVDEPADIEYSVERKARKEYRCCECGSPIVTGQR